MINRVVLIGRLTKDPELRYTPSGLAVANMRIAVDKGLSKDKQREGEPTADFFDVVVWQQSAEFAGNYLKKGYLVALDGRLQQRSWVDQNGQKRSTVEVVADRVRNLERREDTEGGFSGAPAGGGAPNRGARNAPADDFGGGDFGPDDFQDPFADQ